MKNTDEFAQLKQEMDVTTLYYEQKHIFQID